MSALVRVDLTLRLLYHINLVVTAVIFKGYAARCTMSSRQICTEESASTDSKVRSRHTLVTYVALNK